MDYLLPVNPALSQTLAAGLVADRVLHNASVQRSQHQRQVDLTKTDGDLPLTARRSNGHSSRPQATFDPGSWPGIRLTIVKEDAMAAAA
jgi:hypothetical protein